VFLLENFVGGISFAEWFALWPDGNFMPWQLVTYSFLHGGIAHIFFNMFGLYMFGSEIERLFGSRFYLLYYLASVVVAALTHLVITGLMGAPPAPMVGASGGVYGLLLAFGWYFPQRRVVLLFSADPDAGAHLRDRVRRAGAVLRRHRNRRRRRALRAPRGNARRLADDRGQKKKTLEVSRQAQDPSPPRQRAFAALRHPGFRPYFAFSALAMMADSVEHVISYWILFQKFHSPALGGFAMLSHWLPFCSSRCGRARSPTASTRAG